MFVVQRRMEEEFQSPIIAKVIVNKICKEYLGKEGSQAKLKKIQGSNLKLMETMLLAIEKVLRLTVGNNVCDKIINGGKENEGRKDK
ncbi:hypothetical protein KKG63_03550 [Patescibacteria group bacterium]|nr:hypothetical protein [Patescibacteria group bacterium]